MVYSDKFRILQSRRKAFIAISNSAASNTGSAAISCVESSDMIRLLRLFFFMKKELLIVGICEIRFVSPAAHDYTDLKTRIDDTENRRNQRRYRIYIVLRRQRAISSRAPSASSDTSPRFPDNAALFRDLLGSFYSFPPTRSVIQARNQRPDSRYRIVRLRSNAKLIITRNHRYVKR